MRSFEIMLAEEPKRVRFDGVASHDHALASFAEEPALTPTMRLVAAGEGSEGRRSLSANARASFVSTAPVSGRRKKRSLDLFIDGANVTSRMGERDAESVLGELGRAVVALARETRGKKIVRFYEDSSELCLERFGNDALFSLYRAGAEPQIAVFERKLPFADVKAAVTEAILALGTDAPELAALAAELESVSLFDFELAVGELSTVALEVDKDAPVSFSAEFALRERTDASLGEAESADVHALLFRGKLRVDVRGRTMDLGECYPFFFAEKLTSLVSELLESWQRGLARHTRLHVGNVLVGARTHANGQCALMVGNANSEGAVYTFPGLSVTDVCDSIVSFGRALIRGMLRRDRGQARNLRVATFRRALREASDAIRAANQSDSKVNEAPESYRAFAAACIEQVRTEAPASGKLRYRERWRAMVPGIDLRSTFLCGSKLVIGAQFETFCLDRVTGAVEWRMRAPRASSVITPQGLVRIGSDGQLALHSLDDGGVQFRSWLAPRVGGPTSGAVVNSAGLPKLLIVTEGEKHLVALDLMSGEARWRIGWGQGGTLRMRRFGKLVYLASGDSALSAVDIATGQSVWRIRDRLRFRSAPIVEHEFAYAIAGGSASMAALYGIDPYSGQVRFRASLGDAPVNVEAAPIRAGNAVVVVKRASNGASLHAFDRTTGKPMWTTEGSDIPAHTSWLGVDDRLIGHSASGEVMGLCSSTGRVLYRHNFGKVQEVDLPRRLEPVLRSGALFIPHGDLPIIRPSDGLLLGRVGTYDTIPDLLRVDERCDVYAAEESGHLVSLGAAPKLSLVPAREGLSVVR